MNQFLVLLKGKGALDYSPDELQKRLEEYREWVDKISEHYVSDNRLEREGRYLSGDDISTDGPFLEAKEIIAGFIVLKASDLDEATRIAQTSPLLKYFDMVVRPML